MEGITLALTFSGLVDTVVDYIGKIIALLSAFLFIVFVYGMIKFIRSAGDEKARTEGKSIMLWGLVTLFVLVSAWGLVSFVVNTLEIDPDQTVVSKEVIDRLFP